MPNGNVGTFKRAMDVVQTFDDFVEQYKALGLNRQGLRRMFDKQARDKLYLSEHYQVAIDKTPPHQFNGAIMWHLSIKRIDREPIMDWRDLQAIKNQLCGDEAEALQLFPAESRCVDTSNQYHLWVFMKSDGRRFPTIPCGWTARTIVADEAKAGAKQRPMEGNDK